MAMFSSSDLYADNGHAKTRSLVVELVTAHYMDAEPIFTLRDEKEGYVSLKKLYIQHCVDDPSEVSFVDTVFGDWSYWEKLKSNKTVAKEVEGWKKECTVRRKSQAFKAIIKEVKEDGRNAFQAAKYLIQEPYEPNTKVSKQTKKDTTKAAKDEHEQDLARLKEFFSETRVN